MFWNPLDAEYERMATELRAANLKIREMSKTIARQTDELARLKDKPMKVQERPMQDPDLGEKVQEAFQRAVEEVVEAHQEADRLPTVELEGVGEVVLTPAKTKKTTKKTRPKDEVGGEDDDPSTD